MLPTLRVYTYELFVLTYARIHLVTNAAFIHCSLTGTDTPVGGDKHPETQPRPR